MRPSSEIEAAGGRLIESVDATLAGAVEKAGAWVVCRPGCHECCKGPFDIGPLDALRLARGLAELSERDPTRAASVRCRAARLAEMADDDLCPALDPATGTCDLYAARPLMCRVFGPATRWGGPDVGTCELCFEGANDSDVAACAVDVDPDGVYEALNQEFVRVQGSPSPETVAACLRL